MVGITSSDVARVSPGRRRADIQGLRALAVLLVVAYHLGLLDGGFIGVDVFFVISGFVITRMLLGEQLATGRVALGRFYLRRIRRLLPALALFLVGTTLAAIALTPLAQQAVTARTAGAASLFVANVALMRKDGGYFAADAQRNPMLHVWSLAVEEQFYLVFPILLAVGWALGRRLRRQTAIPVALLTAASIVSFWLAAVLVAGRPSIFRFQIFPKEIAFYASPTRAWEFGVGALLAFVPARRMARPALAAASWVALAALIGCAAAYDDQMPFPGVTALLPVLATAALLAGGECRGSAGAVLLSNRPAGWIGNVSYGWYLWHWPLIVFSGSLSMDPGPPRLPLAMAGAALGLVVAWLSFRFVENPIRTRTGVPARRTVLLGVACVAASVVATVALATVGQLIRSDGEGAAVMAGLQRHLDETDLCNIGVPLGQAGASQCVFGPGRSGQAVLVGDSNAGHFSEPFVAATQRAGLQATIATMPGCPFIDARFLLDGLEARRCRDFYVGTVAHLKKTKPDVVVVALALDLYADGDEYEIVEYWGGPRAGRADQRRPFIARGLAAVVRDLSGAGIHVVVVDPIPKFYDWSLQRCTLLRLAVDSCDISRRLDDLEPIRAHAAASARAAVRGAGPGGAQVLDVAGSVCPESVCTARRNGQWWWNDGRHLSVDGARVVTDDLAAALARRPR